MCEGFSGDASRIAKQAPHGVRSDGRAHGIGSLELEADELHRRGQFGKRWYLIGAPWRTSLAFTFAIVLFIQIKAHLAKLPAALQIVTGKHA
jgi:hypothetical protein